MLEHTEFNLKAHRTANLWITVFGAALFFVLVILVIYNDISSLDKHLNREADNHSRQYIENIQSGSKILDGFSAYFDSVDIMNYAKLEDYSKSVRKSNPYIHMSQYIFRIPGNELDEFIKMKHSEGYATYDVKQFDDENINSLIPVKERSIYFPIVFMDPLSVKSSKQLGYDMYSMPLIHEAIDKAIESGKNYISRPFSLFDNGMSYLMIRPIYTTNKLPENKAQRHKLTTHLITILIRVEDILATLTLSNSYSIYISHYDNILDKNIVLGNKLSTDTLDTGILPVFKTVNQHEVLGQVFQLTTTRAMQWSDIAFEWIAFSLIMSVALSLLILNVTYFRIESEGVRRRTQAELFNEKELAEVTLHSIGEAVITTNLKHKILYMNPIAIRLTGWDLSDALNLPLDQVFRIISEETREEVSSTVDQCIENNSTVVFEEPTILISKNGDEYSIENSSAPINDHNKNIIGAVLVFRNITNIRNLSKKMEYQATHDALTSLINRNEFEHQLRIAITTANNENKQHAICYLDLDQFKIINDTCGHIAGDQLLRELSKLMPETLRSSDCLARLGGDEFGLLMFDCPLQKAVKVAESLRQTIKDFTFSWDKKHFEIGASIGLVPITQDCGTLQDILLRADSACYIAKEKGRNRVHVYTPDDLDISKRFGEMQWVTRIKAALDNNYFVLAIQDIRPLDPNNNCIHREILLRMRDENGEMIPPMSFIPAAERYDLMTSIDKWVISSSIKMINKENSKNIIYNINLSGQTLTDSNTLDFIRDEIKKLNLPYDQLCFEITETAVIANLGVAVEFINAMKKIGCKFALDDFGSGLSSFAYLKRLDIDYVKIDGEFVRDILDDPMDRAIVRAINDIAHEMKLETIAEYVENDAVVELLTSMGVDYAQGYGISKPKLWEDGQISETNSVDQAHSA